MSENKICLYKVECELTNWKDRFTNHDGDTLFFPAAMYSEQVYYESKEKYHICLSRMIRRKRLIFCVLATPDYKSKALNDYVCLSGLSINNVTFSEVDIHDGYKLLRAAKDRGLGINENIVFERFGFDHHCPRHNSKERITE